MIFFILATVRFFRGGGRPATGGQQCGAKNSYAIFWGGEIRVCFGYDWLRFLWKGS